MCVCETVPWMISIICHETEVSYILISEAPVKFTKPLENAEVTEDETVTLTCEVSKPNATVQWNMNGQPITPGLRYKVTVDGCVHKLTIPKACLDDQAEYTASVDDVSSKANLTVQGIAVIH